MSTMPQVEPTTFAEPTWDAIRDAHARIAPRIHRTPVLTSHSLDAMGGARFFFKCDNFQKTGSFKIRGAANAILSLSDAEAAHGIVTPSSGNHGPVQVAKTYHFSYADGTPYFLLGTTLYNWLNREESLQHQTLETLSESPFTKIRFGLFPK